MSMLTVNVKDRDPKAGVIGAIINAAKGAVVLLLIVRLVRGGGHWTGSVIGGRRRWEGRG
jgi:hypothetical protein